MTPLRKATLGVNMKGFTFVELLVVITIIGIIFAGAAVAYGAVTVRSRDARRKTDLELIRQALEMCRSIAGSYPAADIYIEGGITCDNATVTLENVPVDPKPISTCDVTGYTYSRTDTTAYSLSVCLEADLNYPPNIPYVLTSP